MKQCIQYHSLKILFKLGKRKIKVAQLLKLLPIKKIILWKKTILDTLKRNAMGLRKLIEPWSIFHQVT